MAGSSQVRYWAVVHRHLSVRSRWTATDEITELVFSR